LKEAFMDSDTVITSDQLLTAAQKGQLSSVLNELIPPSDDGKMPGAGQFDLVEYLNEQAPEAMPIIKKVLNYFGPDFSLKSANDRHLLVVEFSTEKPVLFELLLFHTYARYYQDDRVLVGIGSSAGPPFPRGNSVDAGDLSLLDNVVKTSAGYRQV